MIVMNLEINHINVEIPVFNNTLSDFRATTETEVYNICMNSHAFNHLLQRILISLI